MKKLYTLSLVLFGSLASFAQVFYSENFGTPTGNTLIPAYSTGTAPATFQNGTPVAYSGTADVRVTAASTGYTGASGGGNVFITNTVGKYLQIDGLNSSAYASANLELSFGLNSPNTTALLTVEASTNGGTTWTPLTYTQPGSGWKLVTIGGGAIPSSATLSLRFSQPDPVTGQFRVDDVILRNGSNTCLLNLGSTTALCDANTANIDTYTATIPFTGGGTATYSIVASTGTIGGDNPSTTATGNITITGAAEGTSITVTITGGTCTLSSTVTAPQCAAVNALPFSEPFNYTPGTALTAGQTWGTLNSGDAVTIQTGSLNYTGLSGTANSASFVGTGAEAVLRTTSVTSGTIYASFLMNVTDIPAAVTSTTGTYFAALYGGPTTFNARVFIKKSGTGYVLGGTNATASPAADSAFGTTVYNVGDTVLVVIGYDFTNNELKFWFNPTVAGFSASTPATITETPTSAIATVGGFLLRQDADTTTPAITIDELRISQSTATLLAVAQNDIAGLKVYPNPVTNGKLFIETANNGEKAVVVYDVLGKQVLNTTTSSNEVNVAGLTTGVYVVKITEEGNTATKKLVIK